MENEGIIKKEDVEQFTILYVEDEAYFFEMVLNYTKHCYPNFLLTNASDVRSAKELFDSDSFDAIVCDYRLPDQEDGIVFLDYVRQKDPKIPFIILTGTDERLIAARALNSGANYYFEKGCLTDEGGGNFESMFSKLRHSIARRRDESLMLKEVDIVKKLHIVLDVTLHDLLNLLMAGSLSVECLESSRDPIMIENRKLLRNIFNSQTSMEVVINFCKNYIKMGNKIGWQSPHAITQKLIRNFSPKFDIIDNMISGEFLVFADALLEKVFYNLFENAISHGGAEHIRCYSRIEDDGLVIVIEDDGLGISPEQKEVIFIQGCGRNTGYGLFFCKEVLSFTGIGIREVGKHGEGARFELVAPIDKYEKRN